MAAKDSEDDKAPLVPKVSGPDVITYTYDGSVKTKIERDVINFMERTLKEEGKRIKSTVIYSSKLFGEARFLIKVNYRKEGSRIKDYFDNPCTVAEIAVEVVGLPKVIRAKNWTFVDARTSLKIRESGEELFFTYEATSTDISEIKASPRQYCGDLKLYITFRVEIRYKKENGPRSLTKDLAFLAAKKPACIFVCGEEKKKVPCNKMLLAMRSGIFTTQVPHGWVAVDGEEIVLSEFSPKTVGAFVWFLCSDEVNLSAPYRDLLALYRLAYKYDVPMLKQVAVDALATKIDVDSVIEILVEMKERTAVQEVLLKEKACKFIMTNREKVMIMESWSGLVKEHPDLLRDILECEIAVASKSKDAGKKEPEEEEGAAGGESDIYEPS